MQILITGVTGQVGSAAVRRFSGLGAVMAADRATLDLSRPEEIGDTLDALRPDLIINPAAYTAVDRAEDERELAFLVNAAGPEALALWSAAHGVPLIHLSTDYVFDGQGHLPWREDDATHPLGAYGASKLAGERAIRAAGGPHLIVRTSWVYSARGANFLRTMARLARERTELRVVDDQIGAPTSAAFIADALRRIVEPRLNILVDALSSSHGILHLTTGGATNWCGFAQKIVDGLRRRSVPTMAERVTPISSAEYPTKAVRPLNSRLDLSRLRDVFGLVPPAWEDVLEPELDELVAREVA